MSLWYHGPLVPSASRFLRSRSVSSNRNFDHRPVRPIMNGRVQRAARPKELRIGLYFVEARASVGPALRPILSRHLCLRLRNRPVVNGITASIEWGWVHVCRDRAGSTRIGLYHHLRADVCPRFQTIGIAHDSLLIADPLSLSQAPSEPKQETTSPLSLHSLSSLK
jgi:hypothetical protein